MNDFQSGVVEIVRDFLVAHDALQRLFRSFRDGSLRFDEVENLVGDSPGSPLFRLKERCHALFRGEKAQSPLAMRREALFDLAVGSLFHEAMKFRENFYQLDVYAPRVRQLQSEAGDEGSELFGEFDKILEAAESRLDESLSETEALLAQTAKQLRVLLVDQRDNGLLARYLIEKRDLVERVLACDLDDLLAQVHGEAALGYVAAARSHLASAHFQQALAALREAKGRMADGSKLARLESYALGMQAFLAGDYGPSLKRLGEWVEAEPADDEAMYAPLARAALAFIEGLGADASGVSVPPDLTKRIQKLAGDAKPR